MRFASACGALVCQGAGAIDPQPLCADVARFLNGIDDSGVHKRTGELLS
jgi:fructokinase